MFEHSILLIFKLGGATNTVDKRSIFAEVLKKYTLAETKKSSNLNDLS